MLPASGGGFDFDGPEMLYIGDELFIYYRNTDNRTSRAKLVSTAVPEPSSVMLAALAGLIVLAFAARGSRSLPRPVE